MAGVAGYYKAAGLMATLSGLAAALLPWFFYGKSEFEAFNYFLWGHVFTVAEPARFASVVVYYFLPTPTFSPPLFFVFCTGVSSVAINGVAVISARRGAAVPLVGDPAVAHAAAGVLALGTVVSYAAVLQRGGLQVTPVAGPPLMVLSFILSLVSALLAKLAQWQPGPASHAAG